MTMSVSVAQLRITREIREMEEAWEEALLRNAGLFATLVTARRETGSESFLGHETLLHLAKSQQTLLAAGSELARVHGGLLEIGRERAILEECPPNEPMKGSVGGSKAA